jgi:hypothetical protein
MSLQNAFGPIALLGSGETSLAGGRIFEMVAQGLAQPLRIAILETPAGFELNSSRVAGRVKDYLLNRLQNFNPLIEVIPARKKWTLFSPDNASILTPLLDANLIFMGPGSPTYAVRQLHSSLAWDLIRTRHRLGAALVFASAATISIGAQTLPVYEIYKVGEDVRVVPGLDLFADFGLPISCIPHWNNAEGGDELDTSRCYVGLERFTQWCKMLPPGGTTIGLDEHTGLILDLPGGRCMVSGVSSVTLLRERDSRIFPSGAEFSLEELGRWTWPESTNQGISTLAWEMITNRPSDTAIEEMPEAIQRLAEERKLARDRKDWKAADSLREQIDALGWTLQDTPQGQKLVRR